MKHFALISLILLWSFVSACNRQSPNVDEPLTRTHDDEVRSLIETYYMAAGSLDTWHDRNKFSQVATGPLLKSFMSIGTLEHDATFYVTSSAAIYEVHVIDYSDTQIKAVGCGQIEQTKVNADGTKVGTSSTQFIRNVFVFRREDDVWKLFTGYPFSDPQTDLREFAYVSSEEKTAIGNLQTYIDQYFPCKTGP